MTQVHSRVESSAAQRPPTAHTVRARPRLPGGRAVVGGFLVALAAVGMFSAYTGATAGPRTVYAVAARDLAPGDRIDGSALRLVPIDLPDEQRRRSYDAIAPLVDATVVEPLVAGELVQEGSLVATGAEPGTRSLSFAIDPARAVNARLKPGERIDVLSTFGTGGDACTYVVAAGVPIVAVHEVSSSLVGQGTGVTVTVQVDEADSSVAIAHAASAGTLTLVRATASAPADVPPYCTPPAGDSGGGD